MRTIDADALKETFQRWNKCKDYNSAERNIIRAAIIAVEDQPTVDAIPVEWLQRRRDIYLKAYHAGHESEIHTAAILNDTLMAWRKEQEART